MDRISEHDFDRAGILMAAYCALCGAALALIILLAIFGDEFVACF